MKPTPKPRRLILIRHGESAHNALPKEGGIITPEAAQTDIIKLPDHKIPLTEQGRTQALLTGEGLYRDSSFLPDVIYHSYYQRTQETLDRILEAYPADVKSKIKIRGNPLLGERRSGYIYGLSRKQIDQYFPWYQGYLQREGYFRARPPGGESHLDVLIRIYLMLGQIIKHRPGQTVWVVCHGGIIRGFRFLVERWSPEEYEADKVACENCALTDYILNEQTQQLQLNQYNRVFW